MKLKPKRTKARALCVGLGFIVSGFFLSGCGPLSVNDRIDSATHLANATGFEQSTIATDTFLLTSFHKLEHRSDTLRIYIEGDGHAWSTRYRASNNPTPINPLALKLALRDPHTDVLYLARPCQYAETSEQTNCEFRYWTNERYSRTILDSVNQSVDAVLESGRWSRVELVGFSGGATLALLLAAHRNDVTSVRTIAGNLSPDAFTRHHQVSPLTGSLTPIDYLENLGSLPQRHFLGSEDSIITKAMSRDYHDKIESDGCSSLIELEGVSHSKGWLQHWPELLWPEPSCTQ